MKRMFLYVIASGDRDVVKIGVSAAPDNRRNTLQDGHPYRLKVQRTWPLGFDEAYHVENILKRLLSAHKLQGEWYALSLAAAVDYAAEVVQRTDGGKTRDAYAHLFPRNQPNRKPVATLAAIRDGSASFEARLQRIKFRWQNRTVCSIRNLLAEVKLTRQKDAVVAALGEPSPRWR